MRVCFAAVLAFVAAISLGRAARAESRATTCVKVESERADARDLERLVRAEVERHPTHAVADAGCATHLVVELVEVAGERFLTGRLDGQVPHRLAIDKARGVGQAVEELVRVLLHDDPLVLRGPESTSFFASTLGRLRRDGTMLFGAEAYEELLFVAGASFAMPGVALRARREIGAVELGVRVAGAFRPRESAARLETTAHVGAHAELAVFSSADSDVAAYAALLVGLEHQRFAGPAPLLGPEADGTAFATGLSFGVRAGVELMRTTTTRFDAFAAALAPAFRARDADGGVVDAYTPSVLVGAGLAF